MVACGKILFENAVTLFLACYYFKLGEDEVRSPFGGETVFYHAFFKCKRHCAVALDIKITFLMVILAFSYRIEGDDEVCAEIFLREFNGRNVRVGIYFRPFIEIAADIIPAVRIPRGRKAADNGRHRSVS